MITCTIVSIDWNCVLGERCGTWASYLELQSYCNCWYLVSPCCFSDITLLKELLQENIKTINCIMGENPMKSNLVRSPSILIMAYRGVVSLEKYGKGS